MVKVPTLRFKLEYKILIIIVIALLCGLGLSVIISIKRESDNIDIFRTYSALRKAV